MRACVPRPAKNDSSRSKARTPCEGRADNVVRMIEIHRLMNPSMDGSRKYRCPAFRADTAHVAGRIISAQAETGAFPQAFRPRTKSQRIGRIASRGTINQNGTTRDVSRYVFVLTLKIPNVAVSSLQSRPRKLCSCEFTFQIGPADSVSSCLAHIDVNDQPSCANP